MLLFMTSCLLRVKMKKEDGKKTSNNKINVPVLWGNKCFFGFFFLIWLKKWVFFFFSCSKRCGKYLCTVYIIPLCVTRWCQILYMHSDTTKQIRGGGCETIKRSNRRRGYSVVLNPDAQLNNAQLFFAGCALFLLCQWKEGCPLKAASTAQKMKCS